MALPIASQVHPDFFKMPPMFGIQIAPWRASNQRVWGKRHMIEYLIRLATDWGAADNMYDQIDEHGNFALILLGDIAPDGGHKNKADPMNDHKSHRSGVDVDIYVIRKDGKADRTNISDKTAYDFKRTLALAKAIYAAGNPDLVDKVFFDDQDVIAELKKMGIRTTGRDTGRPATATSPALPPTPHQDHFHVRLKPQP